jgi:type IV pilus assembly protein PilA
MRPIRTDNPYMPGRKLLSGRDEGGFTLIELLVVILIIAILAALAIPIYLNQREKAWISQVQSALKNASTAVESWQVTNSGTTAALDEQSAAALSAEGFDLPSWAVAPDGYMTIESDGQTYCIQAQHNQISPSSNWFQSVYQSDVGQPSVAPNVCPELTP